MIQKKNSIGRIQKDDEELDQLSDAHSNAARLHSILQRRSMELARIIVIEIAIVPHRVVSAATEYARHRGFRNVPSCHFRLEKEMQRISVAAGGILGALSKSSLPNGPPLDNRLQEWFSTDEPPTCLDTLHQMERMLQNDTWMNTAFNFVNVFRSSPPEDKIDAAVKLFDSRRNYFHFLLTTDVWWVCENFDQFVHDPTPQELRGGSTTTTNDFGWCAR